MPPYLAGREAEQGLLRTLLRRLDERVPLPGEVILYGPRGNGKTVLLGWLRQEAASSGQIETVVLLPSATPDVTRLSELLRRERWWNRFSPGQLGVAGVSWGSRTDPISPPPVADILTARARKAPLLVVMDEAHTLDLDVGRALLNAAQEVRQRLPLLLVLAGTPNLEGHLGAMDASFWNRARHMRIGRLDQRATEEAFGRPFEAEGVPVKDGVLAETVRCSHGYPYFIQLLGQAVWGIACTPGGHRNVTTAVLEAALPAFEETKRNYYRYRYRELEERGLLRVGRAVARAFEERAVLGGEALREAIRAGGVADDVQVSRSTRTLSDLGFLWETSGEPAWEPGIPSLMEYILEFAPSTQGTGR